MKRFPRATGRRLPVPFCSSAGERAPKRAAAGLSAAEHPSGPGTQPHLPGEAWEPLLASPQRTGAAVCCVLNGDGSVCVRRERVVVMREVKI